MKETMSAPEVEVITFGETGQKVSALFSNEFRTVELEFTGFGFLDDAPFVSGREVVLYADAENLADLVAFLQRIQLRQAVLEEMKLHRGPSDRQITYGCRR